MHGCFVEHMSIEDTRSVTDSAGQSLNHRSIDIPDSLGSLSELNIPRLLALK